MTINLIEFIPGTKAKAEEVNSNFTALKNAVLTKADKEGDATQNFSVASGTENNHAVNKGQFDTLQENLTTLANSNALKNCIKGGDGVDSDGKANLLTYSGIMLSVAAHKCCDMDGIEFEKVAYTIDCTALTDGTYILFENNNDYDLNICSKYIQATTPTTPIEGDVWINLEYKNYFSKKYSDSQWTDYKYVPVGEVTITSGSITKVKNYAYNENGNPTNKQSITNLCTPDYENGIIVKGYTASNNQFTCPCNGYIYAAVYATNMDSPCGVFINDNRVSTKAFTYNGISLETIIVSKGDKFYYTTNYTYDTTKFYPMKGAE